jgi:hypothetical protein
MTEALASKTCTPCRGGIPPLTREQAELFHAQAPDWQLAEEAHRIERSFSSCCNGPRPRLRAPMTLVVMPDECQSIPITAPND